MLWAMLTSGICMVYTGPIQVYIIKQFMRLAWLTVVPIANKVIVSVVTNSSHYTASLRMPGPRSEEAGAFASIPLPPLHLPFSIGHRCKYMSFFNLLCPEGRICECPYDNHNFMGPLPHPFPNASQLCK